MVKDKLIEFESEIADLFNNKKIKSPVHLYHGNEDYMIKIFEEINKERDLETGKEGMKTVSTISTTANTENNKLELAGKDIEYKIIPDNDNH